MEAVEAEAEVAETTAGSGSNTVVNFFQRPQEAKHSAFLAARGGRRSFAVETHVDDGREEVIDMLRTRSVQLKSAMLTSLVSRLQSDPFSKIKTLIEELINRLLAEANS